jgi:glycosyltransferase involved in cell wall biosynthesis
MCRRRAGQCRSLPIPDRLTGLADVKPENAGISAARNHAVQLAQFELVAFLDADDARTPNSLADRFACLRGDPSAGGAAGLVEQFVSPELPQPSRRELVAAPGPSAARVAGAMLVRREPFDPIGGFDSGFYVGETIDWVARADAADVIMRRVDLVLDHRRQSPVDGAR